MLQDETLLELWSNGQGLVISKFFHQTELEKIQRTCINLFKDLHFETYARIDGILSTNHSIYLNDPNTTAGMNPSSFLFHQAAEIGLNPSQLLTFLIRNSLATSIHNYKSAPNACQHLQTIDTYLTNKH